MRCTEIAKKNKGKRNYKNTNQQSKRKNRKRVAAHHEPEGLAYGSV